MTPKSRNSGNKGKMVKNLVLEKRSRNLKFFSEKCSTRNLESNSENRFEKGIEMSSQTRFFY